MVRRLRIAHGTHGFIDANSFFRRFVVRRITSVSLWNERLAAKYLKAEEKGEPSVSTPAQMVGEAHSVYPTRLWAKRDWDMTSTTWKSAHDMSYPSIRR